MIQRLNIYYTNGPFPKYSLRSANTFPHSWNDRDHGASHIAIIRRRLISVRSEGAWKKIIPRVAHPNQSPINLAMGTLDQQIDHLGAVVENVVRFDSIEILRRDNDLFVGL